MFYFPIRMENDIPSAQRSCTAASNVSHWVELLLTIINLPATDQPKSGVFQVEPFGCLSK